MAVNDDSRDGFEMFKKPEWVTNGWSTAKYYLFLLLKIAKTILVFFTEFSQSQQSLMTIV